MARRAAAWAVQGPVRLTLTLALALALALTPAPTLASILTLTLALPLTRYDMRRNVLDWDYTMGLVPLPSI